MNDAVIVSIVSAVSGVVVAYIANVAAKRVQAKKEKQGPTDRMEQMFDGYERLIQQKDREDARKEKLIGELEEEISITKQMVRNLEQALDASQKELERSREDNAELKAMLGEMRNEYKLHKQEEKKQLDNLR